MNSIPANPIIETICDEQARGHIVARAKPLMPGRFQLDFADSSVRQYDLPAGTTAEQFREWWHEAQQMKNLEWCGMEELGVPAAPRIDPTSR